jgi:hypothetical protein
MIMKNVALCVASAVFFVVSGIQFARYKMGVAILIGHEHAVPVHLSLYAAIAGGVLGLWMLIAACYCCKCKK